MCSDSGGNVSPMADGDGIALLLVDVQRDFCAGGTLAVPMGDAVVPPLNRIITRFHQEGCPIYASRDWHPPVSEHFKALGGPWPTHCVAGTPGAQFHQELRLPADAIIVSKGQTPTADGYSAFEGSTSSSNTLLSSLQQHGIRHLIVGGLATDYCVRQSVLDALQAGLRVTVASDAVAGVDLSPGDSARALDEMRAAGAVFSTTEELGLEASSRYSPE